MTYPKARKSKIHTISGNDSAPALQRSILPTVRTHVLFGSQKGRFVTGCARDGTQNREIGSVAIIFPKMKRHPGTES